MKNTIYLPSAVSSIINALLIILLILSWNLPVAAVAILSFCGLMISPMLFYALMKERVSPSVLSSDEKVRRLSASKTSICFEEVSFAYNRAEGEVLREVSFQLPAQTTTALVGVSGSGKSTIAQLLAGFYTADRGRICIGDILLSEETVDLLQENIAAVWQDAHMFYGTAEENIRIGKPEATEEENREAAKKANIHAFIETLPQGYQTVIGERGLRLSGGEKQRLSIAQAFLKNSLILVLDEASANLDAENERMINEAVQDLKKGRATLVIAHRLSAIRSADRIVVLREGKVDCTGSYEELIAGSTYFRRLIGEEGGREK